MGSTALGIYRKFDVTLRWCTPLSQWRHSQASQPSYSSALSQPGTRFSSALAGAIAAYWVARVGVAFAGRVTKLLQHNIIRCRDNYHACRGHLGKGLGDRGLIDTSASAMHKRHLCFSKSINTLKYTWSWAR